VKPRDCDLPPSLGTFYKNLSKPYHLEEGEVLTRPFERCCVQLTRFKDQVPVIVESLCIVCQKAGEDKRESGMA
jgi:hypothetical protein